MKSLLTVFHALLLLCWIQPLYGGSDDNEAIIYMMSDFRGERVVLELAGKIVFEGHPVTKESTGLAKTVSTGIKINDLNQIDLIIGDKSSKANALTAKIDPKNGRHILIFLKFLDSNLNLVVQQETHPPTFM